MTVPKVFVVGCARSGTSWVRSILSQGPVVSGPESHLFPTLYRPLMADGRAEQRRVAVLHAFDQRAAAGPALGHQGPHRWTSRENLASLFDGAVDQCPTNEAVARMVLGEVLSAYFDRHHDGRARVLAEKTPRHLYFADRILRWWPEAAVVEVVRDGRDVCVSLKAKSEWRSWAAGEVTDQAARWADAVRVGRRFAAAPGHEGRWLTVRYEKLEARPLEEVARLFDFVGLPITRTRAAEIAEATTPERVRAAFDVHHVRQGGSGGWRESFSDSDCRRFDEVAGAELDQLGYRA
jgi:Sulfotransferase family